MKTKLEGAVEIDFFPEHQSKMRDFKISLLSCPFCSFPFNSVPQIVVPDPVFLSACATLSKLQNLVFVQSGHKGNFRGAAAPAHAPARRLMAETAAV